MTLRIVDNVEKYQFLVPVGRKIKIGKSNLKTCLTISYETRPTKLHSIVNMNTITQLFLSYVDAQYKCI